MNQNISQTERLDVLLALAMAFERNRENSSRQISAKVFSESFTALNRENLEILQTRAELFDSLSDEEQKIWQAGWLDKIRRRGRPARLDEQVNPAQVTKVLRGETKSAQELILRYLPLNLGGQVAAELGSKSDSSVSSAAPKSVQKPVSEKVVALVRQKFLWCFITFEDISEPNAADRLSIGELARFVRQLGVRETAIACRGISAKESLAVFLGKFNESDAREIVEYMTELEKIKPFWVTEADKLVRETLESDFQIDEFLQNLGLQLLAASFARRERAAQKYAAQKMTLNESEKWFVYLQKSAADFSKALADERLRLEKRQRIFERLLNRFAHPEDV